MDDHAYQHHHNHHHHHQYHHHRRHHHHYLQRKSRDQADLALEGPGETMTEAETDARWELGF